MAVDSIGFINPETNQLRSKKELEALDKKASETRAADAADSETPAVEDRSTANALGAVRARTSQQVNVVVEKLDRRKETLSASKENLQNLRSTAKDLKEAVKNGDDVKADKLRQEFAGLQAEREKLAKKAEADNSQQRIDGPAQVRVGNKVKASFKFNDVEVKKGDTVDTESTEGLNKFLDDSDKDLENVKAQLQTDKEIRKQVKQVNRDTRGEINSLASASEQENNKQISSLEDAGLLAKKVSDSIKEQAGASLVSQIEASQAEKLLAF